MCDDSIIADCCGACFGICCEFFWTSHTSRPTGFPLIFLLFSFAFVKLGTAFRLAGYRPSTVHVFSPINIGLTDMYPTYPHICLQHGDIG